MRTIELNKGFVAVVDDEDYELVMQYRRWKAVPSKSKHHLVWYAVDRSRCRARPGTKVSMHRLILGAPEGVLVDHVDGDGLNNTRANLRLCTSSQNAANIKAVWGCSRYKGVSPHSASSRWQVILTYMGERIYLGLFDDEEEAARAYDRKALELRGEYAHLNFPLV